MVGLFIIHPKAGEPERIDRDFAIMLHNWAPIWAPTVRIRP